MDLYERESNSALAWLCSLNEAQGRKERGISALPALGLDVYPVNGINGINGTNG